MCSESQGAWKERSEVVLRGSSHRSRVSLVSREPSGIYISEVGLENQSCLTGNLDIQSPE